MPHQEPLRMRRANDFVRMRSAIPIGKPELSSRRHAAPLQCHEIDYMAFSSPTPLP